MCPRCYFQALNRMGLRVVLDVVYNHLAANGPFDDNSVLDKVMPFKIQHHSLGKKTPYNF